MMDGRDPRQALLVDMEGHLTDLRGARAALSKLAEGHDNDIDLAEALHFIAGRISSSTHKLQNLWERATDHKTGGTAS
jgi:hypothetical protein